MIYDGYVKVDLEEINIMYARFAGLEPSLF